jgi:hypothetical protein
MLLSDTSILHRAFLRAGANARLDEVQHFPCRAKE